MRKGNVFFHPIEGTGALTISWTNAPKGNAVEARKGSGVGFFSPGGELLCVIFDEVQEDGDHQTLQFAHHTIEVITKKGSVVYKCAAPAGKKYIRRKASPKRSRPFKMTKRKRASARLG